MSEKVTPETLALWKRLADEATPGPWHNGTVNVYQTNHITRDIWNIARPPQEWDARTTDERWDKDRPFIAAARTAVPALIAEVERLQGIRQSQSQIILELISENEFRLIQIESADNIIRTLRKQNEKLREQMITAVSNWADMSQEGTDRLIEENLAEIENIGKQT